VRSFRAFGCAAWLVASVSGAACSVFPDSAVLPNSNAPGGAGGLLLASGGATAIGGSLPASGGDAQAGGGAGPSAGASGDDAGTGVTAGASSLAGSGAGGAPSCVTTHVFVPPSGDAWIDEAQPDVNHGSDTQLFVLGGASEQRALLSFPIPAASAAQVLARATLVLTLAQPPNLGSGSRVLDVYMLEQPLKENRVTWLNYANGAGKLWTTPGGDVGVTFGSGELHATDATLRLDAGALVTAAYAANQTELGLLVRDDGDASEAPINFAFWAKEEAAAVSPQLDLEYCPQ
jgi:hypothetical protein